MALFRLVFIIFAYLKFIDASTDPCESAMLIHENGGRSTECEIYYEDTCDAYLIDGWYRFQLDATGENLTMATEVVPQGRCGTVNPVWMNGSHPTLEDKIVERVTCLNNGESTCYREYNTSVKNCGGYTVYYLRKTLCCKERYCFGDSRQCHVTTTTTTSTTTTTTSTTTILPTMSEIPISNIGKRWREPRGYDDHGKDNQLTGLTIALSVTVTVLVVAMVGILLYIKVNYRPVVKQANANKIYGVNVLEKPPL